MAWKLYTPHCFFKQHNLSFVNLDQSPIGVCGLPWAKTAAASKWPLRATCALLFWCTWPADADWTLI